MRLYICIFLLCFSVGSAAEEEEALFNKALKALQEDRIEEAAGLFSAFLKIKPQSQAGRFNLALSLYRQNQNQGIAQAYWRQILFENPYSLQTKIALKAVGDKKYFWLWLPVDLILALMALSWGALILFLFQKKLFAARLWIPVGLLIHCFGAYYFYHRRGNYSSLIQDSVVLSAPDLKAPVLFEQKAGVLLKVLQEKNGLQKWSHVQISPTKSGWLYSHLLLPLKVNIKSAPSRSD